MIFLYTSPLVVLARISEPSTLLNLHMQVWWKKSGSNRTYWPVCCCHPTFFFPELCWSKSLLGSIHFTTNLFQILTEKKIRHRGLKVFLGCVSPALLLEVLLALGLLVVVPKSLLVLVPSLASVGDHDFMRDAKRNEETPSERFQPPKVHPADVLQNVITWSLMAKLYMMDFLGFIDWPNDQETIPIPCMKRIIQNDSFK